jgi:hypothetical protein
MRLWLTCVLLWLRRSELGVSQPGPPAFAMPFDPRLCQLLWVLYGGPFEFFRWDGCKVRVM